MDANVTQYLLDLQPGLSVVLAATQGANTTRYVHGPMGIHAHKDATNNWEWPLHDGLGSVREVADNNAAVLESRQYEPYGTPFGTTGTNQTMYGFTGEPTDSNTLVHLRARNYTPRLGVFTAIDPFEGVAQRAMSLNGYSWVEGNSINGVDPSGMIYEHPRMWTSCSTDDTRYNVSYFQPTSSCALTEQNGITVLARTAWTEGGSLASDDVVAAALMLSQINYYRVEGTWYTLGTWQGRGWTPLTLPPLNSQPRLRSIATLMISGYCSDGNPLSMFGVDDYPAIANNTRNHFKIRSTHQRMMATRQNAR